MKDKKILVVDDTPINLKVVDILLKQISDYYKHATIIALTGNASPTARDEYICFGFTDYLEKPIIPQKMQEIIRTNIN